MVQAGSTVANASPLSVLPLLFLFFLESTPFPFGTGVWHLGFPPVAMVPEPFYVISFRFSYLDRPSWVGSLTFSLPFTVLFIERWGSPPRSTIYPPPYLPPVSTTGLSADLPLARIGEEIASAGDFPPMSLSSPLAFPPHCQTFSVLCSRTPSKPPLRRIYGFFSVLQDGLSLPHPSTAGATRPSLMLGGVLVFPV